MRFLTPSACDAWLAHAPTLTDPTSTLSVPLPPESGRLLFLAQLIAGEITFRQPCLMRVTEWNIWESNNNWHLYYRLRQSYGDLLLINEAPGHLFLNHEMEDLASFLHVAMLFGWDAELRPQAHYFAACLSHDGFIDVQASTADALAQLQKMLQAAKFDAQLRA